MFTIFRYSTRPTVPVVSVRINTDIWLNKEIYNCVGRWEGFLWYEHYLTFLQCGHEQALNICMLLVIVGYGVGGTTRMRAKHCALLQLVPSNHKLLATRFADRFNLPACPVFVLNTAHIPTTKGITTLTGTNLTSSFGPARIHLKCGATYKAGTCDDSITFPIKFL